MCAVWFCCDFVVNYSECWRRAFSRPDLYVCDCVKEAWRAFVLTVPACWDVFLCLRSPICACVNGVVFISSLWKCMCLANCLWLRFACVSLMFTEGGSWRAAHACGARQHSGLHLHRGPSPCSNSCAVSLHRVTSSRRVPRGTLLLQTYLLGAALNCALLHVKKWLWAVDHDLNKMSQIWSLVWQMKGKAVDASVLTSLLCSS